MQKIFLSLLFFLTLAFSFIVVSQASIKANLSGTAIVISQIQIGATGNASQEFVELYNPTTAPIDISGWRVTKKTAAGVETSLKENLSGMIAPHTYLLIAHEGYVNTSIPADSTYTQNIIANDNTILLYNASGALLDKVGMGNAGDKEATTEPNPTTNRSIIRKATATSTAQSLTSGDEALSGNGYDSDNNDFDFITLTTAMPRNSLSPASPPISTPTPQPTLAPTTVPSVTPITPQTHRLSFLPQRQQ